MWGAYKKSTFEIVELSERVETLKQTYESAKEAEDSARDLDTTGSFGKW